MTTLVNDSAVLVNDATLTVNGETWVLTPVQSTPGAPTISSFTPSTALVGDLVVITGTQFYSVLSVRFESATALSFAVVSYTEIIVTVPAGVETGPITVTTMGGSVTSLTDFTPTTPSISSFSPMSGEIGSLVGITGVGLDRVTAATLDGIAASFVIVSSIRIVLTVPAGAVLGPIALTTPEGVVTSAEDFTVIALPTRRRRRIGEQDKDLERLGISIGYR